MQVTECDMCGLNLNNTVSEHIEITGWIVVNGALYQVFFSGDFDTVEHRNQWIAEKQAQMEAYGAQAPVQ
jgi:hypothetical protein